MDTFKEFISKNIDKLLVMLVLFIIYWGSWIAYRKGLPNFGDASIDLVKQLIAAFLTLTVSSKMAPPNSTTTTTSTSTLGTPGPAKTVIAVEAPVSHDALKESNL